MLAVVEDEQQRARREELDHRIDDVLSRQRARVERDRNGVGHELRVGHRRELDERGAVRERHFGAACELQRESRLARTARSRERQQPRVPEQRAELAELAAAADERARVSRQRARTVVARIEPLELGAELGREGGELVAPVDRPVVVAVLRQQLAAVDRERGSVRRRRPGPARVGGGSLEAVDVDVGGEEEHLVAKLDRLRVERAPRDVHGLVEIVRRSGRSAVAPEHVHHLLAVQPVAGSEREQLDQLARLLQPPGLVRHGLSVHGGGEPAEKGDRDVCHTPRMPYRAAPGKSRAGEVSRRDGRGPTARSRARGRRRGRTPRSGSPLPDTPDVRFSGRRRSRRARRRPQGWSSSRGGPP